MAVIEHESRAPIRTEYEVQNSQNVFQLNPRVKRIVVQMQAAGGSTVSLDDSTVPAVSRLNGSAGGGAYAEIEFTAEAFNREFPDGLRIDVGSAGVAPTTSNSSPTGVAATHLRTPQGSYLFRVNTGSRGGESASTSKTIIRASGTGGTAVNALSNLTSLAGVTVVRAVNGGRGDSTWVIRASASGMANMLNAGKGGDSVLGFPCNTVAAVAAGLSSSYTAQSLTGVGYGWGAGSHIRTGTSNLVYGGDIGGPSIVIVTEYFE